MFYQNFYQVDDLCHQIDVLLDNLNELNEFLEEFKSPHDVSQSYRSIRESYGDNLSLSSSFAWNLLIHRSILLLYIMNNEVVYKAFEKETKKAIDNLKTKLREL